MAFTKNPPDILLNGASVPNNTTTTSSALDVSAAIGVMVQVKTISGSGIYNLTTVISILSSNDNNDFDLIGTPYTAVTLTNSAASQTQILSFAIPYAEDIKYLKVAATLSNTTSSTNTVVTVSVMRVTP